MQEPVYLSEEPLKPGLDYYHLRSEGIKFIQELTGSFWTDFNEHDPGVTILEQLCFALTDLSYRADFDVQNHFYSSKKDDFIFLQPNEIFPCNALTCNDYRKLLFDSVFELTNVWVFPLEEKKTSLNGLYRILLDVNDSIKSDNAKIDVVEKVKKVYRQNRTICEDIEEVVILEHLTVYFNANIEIDGKKKAEQVLAEIYFKINQYLSPEIRFYSLEEMKTLGYSIDQIHSGPLLKHGFIQDSELQEKPSRILISDLIKLVMQVEGVVSVKNLYLKINGKVFENQIDIAEYQLPRLFTEQAMHDSSVQFYRGSVPYHSLDFSLVKRRLNELTSAHKRVYRLNENNSEQQIGDPVYLEEYFTIQNDFPLIYGIGEYGIPNTPNEKRKAQARQMKGYLILFEQIMANYLSQLAHVKDLFSLNADVRQTYFYQSIEKIVPDSKPILKSIKKSKEEKERIVEQNQYASYDTGLPALVKEKDNYINRRNRFLDYLLAIHGESFTSYSLSQFNYYFDEVNFEKKLLSYKTKMLQLLGTINRNRAKALDYSVLHDTLDNTGLETKISLLLGISNEQKAEENRSILNFYKKNGLLLLPAETTKFRKKPWDTAAQLDKKILSASYIESNFDYVDIDDLIISQDKEKNKEVLLATLPFKAEMITEEFLREGLHLDKYKIGQIGEENDELWKVIFWDTKEESWISIGHYKTEQEAILAIKELNSFLIELNIQTEKIGLVEHILLRPDIDKKEHGIFMLAPDGKPLLRSKKLYTFEERRAVLEELRRHIGYYENYSVESTKDKDFEVYFKTSDGQHEFVSVVAKASVEETHKDMENLYKLMSDQLEIIPYKNKVGLYIRRSESDEILPEDFFSYRSSVVIPTWSARFYNKEFRAIAEDIIFDNSPANVALSILWLSPVEIEEFEKVYGAWRQLKVKGAASKAELENLSFDLALLLLKFSNNGKAS